MRKYWFVVLALVALLTGMVLPAFAQERPSIPDLLANDPEGRFTTLLAAVNAAGLGDALSGDGPLTLLAPTNDAIAASLETMGMGPEALMGNPEMLTAILSYHVIPERLFARSLFGGGTYTTLEGEDVTFGEGDGGVLAVNGVAISDIDNIASNGVVHAIDGILIPPSVMEAMTAAAATPEAPAATPEPTAAPTGQAAARPSVLEILSSDPDGRFTTLVAAVTAAGLTDTLSGEGPFTILAPTNDAFAAALEFVGMAPEALMADPSILAQILTYHVIPDRVMFRNFIGGLTATTVNGATVNFYEGAGGRPTVNGATISDVDNVGSNGVVQAIDSVLIPPNVLPPAHVRVAHFSPDAPAVDVWLNNEPSNIQGVTFGSVTDWVEITPSQAMRLAVAPEGTTDFVLGPTDISLAPGSWTTIAAIGSAANGTLDVAVIPEDYSAPADGQARVTLFHAIEGAPAVNVYANGGLIVGNLAYPGTVDGNDGVYTLDVNAGTYDLSVNAGGSPILTADNTDLVAGTNYFIAAIGTPDSPQLVVQATAQ